MERNGKHRPGWRPSRGVGGVLVGVGVAVLAATALVPIPSFDALDRREGTLVAAEVEPFKPCRYGDCVRTLATVRLGDDEQVYHFADSDTALLQQGRPITLWTHPEFRGFHRVRVWHAEQEGRVILDYAELSSSDRTIRLVLLLLAPLLIGGGAWILRTRDADGA